MILATAVDIGIAGGGFALAYGGIELAKQAIKKRNGKGDERRSAGFRDDDRLRLEQTQKTGEDCEDGIRDLGSTLADMKRTGEESLGVQREFLTALRSFNGR